MRILGTLLVAVLLLLAGAGFLLYEADRPGPLSQPTTVILPRGAAGRASLRLGRRRHHRSVPAAPAPGRGARWPGARHRAGGVAAAGDLSLFAWRQPRAAVGADAPGDERDPGRALGQARAGLAANHS